VQINISSRHGQLAAESRDRISSKLEKLGRFFDRVASVDATIDLNDEQQPLVEIRVAVDGASAFVARTRGPNLLGAVEGAIHKLEQQLRRHKEKLIGSHRNAVKREATPNSSADTVLEPDEYEEEELT
jgi:putative sigma-54 modulation protein